WPHKVGSLAELQGSWFGLNLKMINAGRTLLCHRLEPQLLTMLEWGCSPQPRPRLP
ncbi:hypothetical protein P7K49_023667, partial [Saguinus oedipus]